MLLNFSSSSSNSYGLYFNYCFFLRDQETNTSVHGLSALFLGVVNALFSFFAVATNTLILAIIWKNSSFRTPSYILLAGLAATDFASGLITQPLYAAYFLVKFNDDLFPCIAITAFHTFHTGYGCRKMAACVSPISNNCPTYLYNLWRVTYSSSSINRRSHVANIV